MDSLNSLQKKNKICPSCGQSIETEKSHSEVTQTLTFSSASLSPNLVSGHLPQDDQVQFTIGPYHILNKIGQGGMGEVFLAYDTICGRRIALKRIRTDLLVHEQIHRRFLKEARVTSQLTHPAIIPIYTIHDEDNLVYYTMPYVEGETLKQILRTARAKEKEGIKSDHYGGIPSLIRIFFNVCQAVGYAHSKKVLHRDIKPENIIIGKYGEVLILDWGLAKLFDKEEAEDQGQDSHENKSKQSSESRHPLHGLTHFGKVVGTVSYMAPERALGSEATVQTDIYSLGIILYQILTLRYPFVRKSLKQFQRNAHLEMLHNPIDVAPYRDVPKVLSHITMKCLSSDPSQRYQIVDDLIYDLESYIEGRAEWYPAAELSITQKNDWEFQENVLIAEHMAITRSMDVSDWVSLMISKMSFDEPIKIEAKIKLGETAHGLGFLLSVPEAAERIHLNDGYTLWVSSDLYNNTKLLRSTVEVFHSPELTLKRHEWYHIRIEKIERHVYFYLNGLLQFSYLGLLPIVGTHIGLLSRDADFEMDSLEVYVGGQNITVNCLAVPDAFLAHKDYAKALSEYRRIGSSFPGRAEGREALFRAGVTLLEEAKNCNGSDKKEKLFDHTFSEFEKLHKTSGAPLEYLGKALVYQVLNDAEEELKCYELALRRFPDHPLLSVIKEQILYRMHESSRYDRHLTYCFVLLVSAHLPETVSSSPVRKLFDSLEKYWERLFFIRENPAKEINPQLKTLEFATPLAFWLNKPYSLIEISNHLKEIEHHEEALGNVIFSLLELGAWKCADHLSESLPENSPLRNSLKIAFLPYKSSVKVAAEQLALNLKFFSEMDERVLVSLIEKAIDESDYPSVNILEQLAEKCPLSSETKLIMDNLIIWSALQQKNWALAEKKLQTYSLKTLSHESSLLHFLYGCWLYATEGAEIASIHFSGILETVHPRSWALFSHYFNEKMMLHQKWPAQAFMYEKRQFYKQASLFYLTTGDTDKNQYFKMLSKECYLASDWMP